MIFLWENLALITYMKLLAIKNIIKNLINKIVSLDSKTMMIIDDDQY